MEFELRKIIINKYKSVKQFAQKIDIPYTTMDSILKRGIKNANINNVMKICEELNINIDKLHENIIEFNDGSKNSEFDILFDKYKDILSNDDKEMIKFIIEKRKKEIDEQEK